MIFKLFGKNPGQLPDTLRTQVIVFGYALSLQCSSLLLIDDNMT